MRVLAIGAHVDDVELGCGATLRQFKNNGNEVHVLVFGSGVSSRYRLIPGDNGGNNVKCRDLQTEVVRRWEAQVQAAKAIGFNLLPYRNMPDQEYETKPLIEFTRSIEDALDSVKPSMVLTHWSEDTNRDHRIVSEATSVACRPFASYVESVLCYEVPGSGSFGNPRYFQEVELSGAAGKVLALQAYAQEMRAFPHPRSYKAIEALMTWRGAQGGLQMAEAFEVMLCR